jgi:integrase
MHIPRSLADDLQRWKEQCPDPSREAFIFPNKTGGFLDTDDYRERVLHKLARDLKLPKVTFQVIRRTSATLAQKKGTVKTSRECSGIPGRRPLPISICRRFPRTSRQR